MIIENMSFMSISRIGRAVSSPGDLVILKLFFSSILLVFSIDLFTINFIELLLVLDIVLYIVVMILFLNKGIIEREKVLTYTLFCQFNINLCSQYNLEIKILSNQERFGNILLYII